MSEFCDKCGGTNKEIDLQGTIATLRCESCGYESITRYHFIEGIDISMLPDAFEVFVINGSRKTYLFVKKAFCGIGNYCHSDLLVKLIRTAILRYRRGFKDMLIYSDIKSLRVSKRYTLVDWH